MDFARPESQIPISTPIKFNSIEKFFSVHPSRATPVMKEQAFRHEWVFPTCCVRGWVPGWGSRHSPPVSEVFGP